MIARIRCRAATADDRGASAVEYGLMLAAVTAIVIGTVFGLGQLVARALSSTSASFSQCTTTENCR